MKFNKSERMFLCILVLTIALLLMALAKPFKLIKTNYKSESLVHTDCAELMLSSTEPVRQNFAPQFGILKEIAFYVHSYGGAESDLVTLKLYNASSELLHEGSASLDVSEGDACVRFPMDVYAEAWQPVYYEIYSGDENEALVTVYVAEAVATGISESGTVVYEGSEQTGFCVCGDYTYRAHMGLKKTLLYDAVIGFTAVLALGLLWFFARPVQIQKPLRIALYALLACGSIAALVYCVFMPTFSSETLDRSIYAIGIAVLTAYLAYLIYGIGRNGTPAFLKLPPAQMLQNYLQSVFFGITLYYCCMYVNAACLADQYLALSQIGFYLGLSMLSLFAQKDFLNIPNAVWILLGGAACCFIQNRTVYKCGALLFGGLVLIYIVRHFKKSTLSGLYLPIAATLVLYNILAACFRGYRTWMIYAGIAFTLLLFYVAVTEDCRRIFKNLSNGISISFLILLAFSLARRPYNKWGLSRYPMWFHTVTAGAAQITLTAANSWGHILKAVSEGGLKGIFKRAHFRIFEFSIAAGYLVLAISRTGILTMAILMLLTLVLYLFADKKAFRKLLRASLCTVAGSILCLPLVFSATRIVPAMVNDPFRFPLIPFEQDWYLIDAGEPKDSEWYMDASMFVKFIGIRIFNGTTDSGVDDIENVSLKEAVFGKEAAAVTETPSTETNAAPSEVVQDAARDVDLSNGRFDIWKQTLKELSLHGHEYMSVEMPDGSTAYHCHNAYLQALYDYGLLIGLLYLVFCFVTFLRSVIFFLKGIKGSVDPLFIVPLSVVCAFGITGVFELTALPMTGITMSFFAIMCLLALKNGAYGRQENN